MNNEIFIWLDEYLHKDWLVYIIIVLAIILLAFVVSRMFRLIARRAIRSSSKILKVDPTQYNFILYAINLFVFLGALILIFYTIPGLRSLGLTLFASAGVITAILVFASQQALSNIISGIFLVASRPFRVGDIIKVGEFRIGKVEDITLRHTVIRDFENRRIIIPNSVINSETVINSTVTEEMICNFVEFGISYDSDVDLAMEIISGEAMKHPNFIDHRTEEEKQEGRPAVRVRLIGFGDSSVNLRAYVWTTDHSAGFNLKCDVFKSVKEQFDRQGIEIPFPYRTVVFKNQPKN